MAPGWTAPRGRWFKTKAGEHSPDGTPAESPADEPDEQLQRRRATRRKEDGAHDRIFPEGNEGAAIETLHLLENFLSPRRVVRRGTGLNPRPKSPHFPRQGLLRGAL